MEDPLRPARGLVNGVLWGIATWALIVALFALIMFIQTSDADASVVITPPKQTLKMPEVSGRWVVFNPSDTKSITYTITTTELLPHELDREDVCQYLLFAPRQVTLAPRSRQTVRFLFKGIPGGPGRRPMMACRIKWTQVEEMEARRITDDQVQMLGHFLLNFTTAIYLDATDD